MASRAFMDRYGKVHYADEETGTGQIPMADVQKQVASQLYGSTKLISIKPAKYDFFFTYGSSKRVPVVFSNVNCMKKPDMISVSATAKRKFVRW